MSWDGDKPGLVIVVLMIVVMDEVFRMPTLLYREALWYGVRLSRDMLVPETCGFNASTQTELATRQHRPGELVSQKFRLYSTAGIDGTSQRELTGPCQLHWVQRSHGHSGTCPA